MGYTFLDYKVLKADATASIATYNNNESAIAKHLATTTSLEQEINSLKARLDTKKAALATEKAALARAEKSRKRLGQDAEKKQARIQKLSWRQAMAFIVNGPGEYTAEAISVELAHLGYQQSLAAIQMVLDVWIEEKRHVVKCGESYRSKACQLAEAA